MQFSDVGRPEDVRWTHEEKKGEKTAVITDVNQAAAGTAVTFSLLGDFLTFPQSQGSH